MKRTCLRWLAASSLLIAALGAGGATRPRYGEVLHINTSAAFSALDPAEWGQAESILRRNITRLLFETLVVLDEHGAPQPWLADSWSSSGGGTRWQFNLRRGVTFSDGSSCTVDAAAAALRKVHPDWRVTAQGDGVSIELESPVVDLPTELALPVNAIVQRGNQLLGTGPFVVARWEAGRRLVLTTRDDYWGSRVFLDTIELEMSRTLREQSIAFGLGRADIIEIAPELSRHAASEGQKLVTSAPTELMALLFARDAQSAGEQKLREALSLSIDRFLISKILLQNGSDPTGSLLPNWMTGYGFVFSTGTDPVRAKQLRLEAGQSHGWTLRYESDDGLARVVAERVSLNARDAGLSIQTTTAASADIRLVRVPLISSNGRLALTGLCSSLGLNPIKLTGPSTESVYDGENGMLQSRRVIPLLHLRYAWAISPLLQDWSVGRDGSWNLSDVWLSGKP